MSLANLSDLQAAITDWIARPDLTTARINDFITLTEAGVQNGTMGTAPLRSRSMELKYTLTLSGEYTNLPSDFLGARRVILTSSNPSVKLSYVTPDFFDASYLSLTGGTELAYTIVGSQIRVGPNAGSGDTVELIYYQAIPGLVANSTNWLMTSYPAVYLYGSLLNSAPYTANDERLPTWSAAFTAAVEGIRASEDLATFAGTTMVQRPAGVTIF